MSVYAPGAPAEIWALVGVTDGAKLLAMWWWSKADHAVQRDPTTCTVWAPAVEGRTPAEALLDDAAGVHPDKAARTIRGYMAELKAAGLASVEGRLVTLTPPSLATPPGPRRGFVYAIKFAGGCVKIGRSSSPDRRIADHASLMCQSLGDIVRQHIAAVEDMDAAERDVIAAVAEENKLQFGSEWFIGGYELAVDRIGMWTNRGSRP